MEIENLKFLVDLLEDLEEKNAAERAALTNLREVADGLAALSKEYGSEAVIEAVKKRKAAQWKK